MKPFEPIVMKRVIKRVIIPFGLASLVGGVLVTIGFSTTLATYSAFLFMLMLMLAVV